MIYPHTALPAEEYRKVWTDDDIAAMNQRTDKRREEMISWLGPRWVGYLPTKEKACPPFPTLDTSMPSIGTATTDDGSAFVKRFMRSVGLRFEEK